MNTGGADRARQKAQEIRESVQKHQQSVLERRREQQQQQQQQQHHDDAPGGGNRRSDDSQSTPANFSPEATASWVRNRLLHAQQEAERSILPVGPKEGDREATGRGASDESSSPSLPQQQRPIPAPQPLVHSSSLRMGSRSGSILELRGEGLISAAASKELYQKMRSRYNYTRPDDDELAKQTFITSLYQDLQWVMRELGYHHVGHDEVEGWALLVHEMLTRETRRYHSVAHVYEVSAGASPLQLLAAMFRNAVCHRVDGGLTERQKGLLEGVLVEGTCILNPSLSNVRVELVASVFGYKPGDDLTGDDGRHKGLVVFLSAVCASRLLQRHLSTTHLAQLAAIMESTIPFRSGPSPLNRLHNRLLACNRTYGLGLCEQDMLETVQQGVDLLNRSLGNMITDDVADFLDHTWRLLPEESPALRKAHMHTLVDYYGAIRSMVQLVRDIDPTSVYGSFHGLPTEADIERFEVCLERNLSLALVYLHVRMLTIAVVGAFACLTGGDAPMSFFFGDLPSLQYESERLGDGLSDASLNTDNGGGKTAGYYYNAEVHDILCGERMEEPGFDTRNAPLAAHLYRSIGDRGVRHALFYCVPEVMTSDPAAWSLLSAFPLDLVVEAGHELGRVAISRQRKVEAVCAELRRRASDALMRFI
jgi:hypothetical protein